MPSKPKKCAPPAAEATVRCDRPSPLPEELRDVIDAQVEYRRGYRDALKVCLEEIKSLADKTDTHGAFWERYLTRELEAERSSGHYVCGDTV